MNENYLKAVEALGKRISELETTVAVKDFQIEELQKALESAEKHINKNGDTLPLEIR